MSKQVINGKTYWQDAKGGLVPDEMIKQIDKERDALVQKWITKAKQLHEQMVDFKGSILVISKPLLNYPLKNTMPN
ncbi:sulfate transport protein cysz [Canicola haemoglobinophilus]|uniref:Sulfate transport protein cysz n=1 Tax=Canicola haemoglobinophilus TaxID=733 RepID=A0A377HUF1_9PAST|nr:sulfate transport protein cysz [Canicola haemoglobinophilus]